MYPFSGISNDKGSEQDAQAPLTPLVFADDYNRINRGTAAPGPAGLETGGNLVDQFAAGLTWYGGGGSDTQFAGDEDDTLDGGDGNDEIHGNGGNDVIHDGDGFDLAYGGTGDDLFIASDDSDAQFRPEYDDRYYGGTGFDHISYEVSAHGWVIDLADGHAYVNVEIAAPDGVGVPTGDTGTTAPHTRDTLDSIEGATGSQHNDDITGNHVNNLLIGLAGNDVIRGLGGDDTIDGGSGIDSMDGGDGIDTILFTDNTKRIRVDLNEGTAEHYGTDAADPLAFTERAANFENVTGTDHDDELLGSSIANILKGGAGDDVIHGRNGHDLLKGNEGNDDLNGGKGDDDLRGGIGDDNLDGGDGDDDLLGGDGFDSLFGGLGDDDLQGGDGDDFLNAGAGVNTADGGAGNDVIWLEFVGTPDLPFFRQHGGSGLDVEGTDHMSNLTATGGEGQDTFYFLDGEATTQMVITDFDESEDALVFWNVSRSNISFFNTNRQVTSTEYYLDTASDGWITEADDGWSLTNGGTALRYDTYYGASLVLEGVTIIDADVIDSRWLLDENFDPTYEYPEFF